MTVSADVTRQCRLLRLTRVDFLKWCATAKPGEMFVYYCGALGALGTGAKDTPRTQLFRSVRDYATGGEVALFHRLITRGNQHVRSVFEYRAVRISDDTARALRRYNLRMSGFDPDEY